MADYATVNDVITLYRALSPEETVKATALIPIVCARLRQMAKNYGRDLDEMMQGNEDLQQTAKSVTVDVVARNLMTPTTGAPMTQFSEAALGYSASGTFLNPGGGIFIKNTELKALGITRQRFGQFDLNGGGWDVNE